MQKKPKPLVFLDSNVLFCGLYSSDSPAGMILDRFVAGELTVVISQQVLEEVVRTIKEKLPVVLPALRKLLGSVSLKIIKNPTSEEITDWTQVIHPEDAAILAAAAAARPDYLVTGDKHFFENPDIAERSRLLIVTPRQFLSYLDD